MDWIARQICTYVHLHDDGDDRRAFVLRGQIVSRGPDNEPLLGSVEPIAELSESVISEAKRRYNENFDVGRESIDVSRA
jgi:hypothetical protein